MRRHLCVLSVAGIVGACGGGGGTPSSSSSPTSPTVAAPSAPVAAEYAISVSVGSRPARVSNVATSQATARAAINVEVTERRGTAGEIRRMLASLRKGPTTVYTEILDETALRAIVPGGSLTIPGSGRLSIPYVPRFPFTRDDQLIIDVQGEFRDAAGNTSSPTSPPVPVPADNIATCFASPNHLCLNNQRFQVDALVNGVRVTTMQRESDTEGRYVFEDLVLLAKVLNRCGLNSRFRVELSVNAARLAFTVFVTDTLVGETKSYLTGSASTPVIDSSAFATCP